jgi:hypothetical protein
VSTKPGALQETRACEQTRCAGLDGSARRSCVETCEGIGGCTPLRTLAYVEWECDSRAGTFDEVLKVRRGNCDPVPVFEGGGPTPSPFLGPACFGGGYARFGPGSPDLGSLQRLGVRPDGSGVVFEVNRDVSVLRFGPPLTPEQQGFFFVRADGSGLRRLGPPSRAPCFQLTGTSVTLPIGTFALSYCSLSFSPDGRSVVFTDLGPGPGGEEAVQIFVLDLATDPPKRTQVTRLPLAHSSIPLFPATGPAEFLDDETLGFYSFANPEGPDPNGQQTAFTVRIDGTELRALPAPVAVSGSQVIPQFAIVGGRASLATLVLPGVPVNPNLLGVQGFFASVISEVFLVSGRNVLQLTNFGRVDTFGLVLDTKRQRAFFSASVDPPGGSNPTRDCQLFSIDTLGAHLRQVTHFRDAYPHSLAGCTAFPRGAGCGVGITKAAREDPATGTIVFDSTCDPFGTNPWGAQLFAVRPDGSRLRVLTHAKGWVHHSDGSDTTDLVGNWDYAPTVR